METDPRSKLSVMKVSESCSSEAPAMLNAEM